MPAILGAERHQEKLLARPLLVPSESARTRQRKGHCLFQQYLRVIAQSRVAGHKPERRPQRTGVEPRTPL